MKSILAISAALSAFASGAVAQSITEESIAVSTQSGGMEGVTALLLAGMFIAVIIGASNSGGNQMLPPSNNSLQ